MLKQAAWLAALVNWCHRGAFEHDIKHDPVVPSNMDGWEITHQWDFRCCGKNIYKWWILHGNVWLQKGGPPNFMGRKSMSIHGVLQGMILAAEARVWGSSVGFLQFNLTLKPSPATYFQQPTCLNKLHARKKENVHAVPISMKIDEKQKGPNPKETSAFEPILIMHLQIKNISFTILVI